MGYDIAVKPIVADGLLIGYESVCPRSSCGRRNFSPFDYRAPHQLLAGPLPNHCSHFKGLYSSGRPGEPYAIYE